MVEALAIATVTGMLLATLSIMIASQWLPDTSPAGWPERGALARHVFWATWALTLAHALWRSSPVAQGRAHAAWREQCLAVSALAVAAALSNWLATGDHLIKTVREPYWPVAGVDLFLLASATIAALVARKLKRLAEAPATRPSAKRAKAAHA